MHYVYIIQSLVDGTYYKGYTEDPLVRLSYHNNKISPYTATKTPWKLVFLLAFETKSMGLIKEKKLKKYPTKSLEALIKSKQNMITTYMNDIENR